MLLTASDLASITSHIHDWVLFLLRLHPFILPGVISPLISNSMLKSRDITLPTKVLLVNAMVFPVVMYGCESCAVKKAERRRIDAFELWCWRRLLRVPWTARRSNQSISEGDQPWDFFGRNDAKAETPVSHLM